MAGRPGALVAVAALLVVAGCDAPAPRTAGTTPRGGGTTGSTVPGGSATTPSAIPTGRGALRITTQLGDRCPGVPAISDPRCVPEPRPRTGFEIRATGRDFVARGGTGPDGQVTVPVDTGTYLVRGEPVRGYRFTPELRVTVDGDTTVDVPLTYTEG